MYNGCIYVCMWNRIPLPVSVDIIRLVVCAGLREPGLIKIITVGFNEFFGILPEQKHFYFLSRKQLAQDSITIYFICGADVAEPMMDNYIYYIGIKYNSQIYDIRPTRLCFINTYTYIFAWLASIYKCILNRDNKYILASFYCIRLIKSHQIKLNKKGFYSNTSTFLTSWN